MKDHQRIGLPDAYRVGIFALIVFSIGRIHQHFGLLALLRPGLLLTGSLLALAALKPSAVSVAPFTKSWRFTALIALLIVAIMGMPFGISLGATATIIKDDFSKVIISAVLLMIGLRNARDLRVAVWAYATSCALLAYFSFFVFRMSSHGSRALRLAEGYMFDPNDLGVIFIVGLPLTIWLAKTSRGIARVTAYGIAVAVVGAIARTGSRGAFVGLAVLALAFVFLYPWGGIIQRAGYVLAASAALAVFAPPGYWDQMSTLLNPSEDYNLSSEDGRLAIARRGFGYMFQYPAFGLGLGNFSRAECSIGPKVDLTPTGTGIFCAAPHNTYVQAAAETGILGFSLYLLLTVGGAIATLRLRTRVPRAWDGMTEERRFLYGGPTFLGFASIGYLVTSAFLSFAWLDLPYVLAALQVGLVAAVRSERARERRSADEAMQQAIAVQPLLASNVTGWRSARHRASLHQ